MTRSIRSTVFALVLGCSVVAMGFGNVVHAGLKAEANVSIGAGSSTASGSMGTARNSADNVQFIRCTVQGFANANAVFCAARNTAGTTFSCTANANSPSFAAAVSAIGVGSRLFIAQSGGVCTQIDVTNSSEGKPEVP
jgi:hypothetical protein